MWPVMTLTFLLQLTDEEQLFAVNTDPCIQTQEQTLDLAPALAPEQEDTCAVWPMVATGDC